MPRRTATMTISIRHTLCALPLKTLSEIHPDRIIPAHPAISNMAIVHPAISGDRGLDLSMRNVGPQSSTAKRTIYTKKLMVATVHMIGFLKTIFLRNALNASGLSLSSSSVLVSFISGRPTEVGVSRSVTIMKSTPAAAMIAGIQKHSCHCP